MRFLVCSLKILSIILAAECAKIKLSSKVAYSLCEQLDIFEQTRVIPLPAKDLSPHHYQIPCGYLQIPKPFDQPPVVTLEPCQSWEPGARIGQLDAGFRNDSIPCKCHVCESILGQPSTYGCKDRPTSAAVRTCELGEGCRTLASFSKTLKTWILRRGCTPLRDYESKCTRYPPFTPPLCPDCKTPSCECVCRRDLCNDFTYPKDGWDVCGNQEPCPGIATTESPPEPPRAIDCHTCVSYENDPTTWLCKEKPENATLTKCQLGEHCQTITYISPKTGGSALARGCVKKEDVTNVCRKDRPIPAGLRRMLKCESCKDPSCECLCDTDKCNNEVFEGDGWKAC